MNRIAIQDRVRHLQHEPQKQAQLEVERLCQNLTAELVVLHSLQLPEDGGVIPSPVFITNDRSDEFDDSDGDAHVEKQPAEHVHQDMADTVPPERRPIFFPLT